MVDEQLVQFLELFFFSESIHPMTQNRKPTGVERFTLICLNISSNILICCSYNNILEHNIPCQQ